MSKTSRRTRPASAAAPTQTPPPAEEVSEEQAATSDSAPQPAAARDPYRWITAVMGVLIVLQVGWLLSSYRSTPSLPPGVTASKSSPEGRLMPPPPTSGGKRPAGKANKGPSQPPPPVAGVPPGPPTSERRIPFEEFTSLTLNLNVGPTALTARQLERLLPLMQRYEASLHDDGDAAMNIYRVLTQAQRTTMYEPHSPPSVNSPRVSGQDPFVDKALALMAKKAAGKPASSDSSVPDAILPTRWSVVEGLLYLESQPGAALNPGQARTALDNLKVIQKQIRVQDELQSALVAVLTPAQRQRLNELTIGEKQSAMAALYVRWLQAAR